MSHSAHSHAAHCAWCKKKMPAPHPRAEAVITRGMCEVCAHRLLRALGRPVQEFLDELGAPVVVLDTTMAIQAANKQAQHLLKKDLPQLEGRGPGEAIGCVNSTVAGGCGKSIHCQSCTIRQTVRDSFVTGTTHKDVVAYPDIQVESQVKQLRMRISTEKRGDIVFLRVDEMNRSRPAV